MTKSFADFNIVPFIEFLEVLLVFIEGSLEWFDIFEGMRHVLITFCTQIKNRQLPGSFPMFVRAQRKAATSVGLS